MTCPDDCKPCRHRARVIKVISTLKVRAEQAAAAAAAAVAGDYKHSLAGHTGAQMFASPGLSI